ncbi:MAG: ATP-binding cassette domain-containing protein [Aquificales bacterium]|nr:ATP-binding cassette domain-containing protein [Aquificales bacterium]
MSELLQAESLSKSFGVVTAVDHINLHINSGEIVAIMGRSGSGKSTAMHLLAGLEQPSGGRPRYSHERWRNCGVEWFNLPD